MKRILIALDGSDVAQRALGFGTEIASKFGAQVHLLAVVEPVFVPPEPYGFQSGAMEAANREYAHKIVQTAAEEVRRSGVDVHTQVLMGAPADLIVQASAEADLVVLGSRGRGAVSRALLGSVSDRVVHLARKPVLIVH